MLKRGKEIKIQCNIRYKRTVFVVGVKSRKEKKSLHFSLPSREHTCVYYFGNKKEDSQKYFVRPGDLSMSKIGM